MSQDVDVAIICANLEPGVVRSVPLVEQFLDHVLTLIHPKADRPLIRFASGVAANLYPHTRGIVRFLN